jgi:hypothetical protein
MGAAKEGSRLIVVFICRSLVANRFERSQCFEHSNRFPYRELLPTPSAIGNTLSNTPQPKHQIQSLTHHVATRIRTYPELRVSAAAQSRNLRAAARPRDRGSALDSG